MQHWQLRKVHKLNHWVIYIANPSVRHVLSKLRLALQTPACVSAADHDDSQGKMLAPVSCVQNCRGRSKDTACIFCKSTNITNAAKKEKVLPFQSHVNVQFPLLLQIQIWFTMIDSPWFTNISKSSVCGGPSFSPANCASRSFASLPAEAIAAPDGQPNGWSKGYPQSTLQRKTADSSFPPPIKITYFQPIWSRFEMKPNHPYKKSGSSLPTITMNKLKNHANTQKIRRRWWTWTLTACVTGKTFRCLLRSSALAWSKEWRSENTVTFNKACIDKKTFKAAKDLEACKNKTYKNLLSIEINISHTRRLLDTSIF